MDTDRLDISVSEKYGNRLRVRVCGICVSESKLLMVNHQGLRKGPFWAPPGGGMDFGLSAAENLTREFKEETGLQVAVGSLLFVTEFLNPPLHALEMFFDVTMTGGLLHTGHDPEMDPGQQQIREVSFLEFSAIDSLPEEHKHAAFKIAGQASQFRGLNGYFRI